MSRARHFLIGLGLFAATLLTYVPALSAGFIWNDSEYVTAPALRSLEGLARIWFEIGATEQYYPILHSAFWLEHQLWGDAPMGYHLINILQHAGAACLLAAVLRRLAVPGAWVAAFVFALHPVCVESVAWVSEQKNTLSLSFYLGAALAYLRYDADRRPRDYAIATGLFVLALLSKTVTATLPAALLVVFWWRRGALGWRRDVAPLLPWFALGAAIGLVSAWVERTFIGAHGAEFALTFGQRALLAGRIVWFYLGKLLWPADLIFIYPRWEVDAGEVGQWLGALGVVAALGALWSLRRRSRAPLAAALFFGGSLFPTLGFFNVYGFMFSFVADHWQYLPSLGIVTLAAAGLTLALHGAPPLARRGVPLALVAGLALLSWRQSRMYADVRTFYRTTIAQNPACWMAHNNLGNLLRADGELDGAIAHLQAALRVRDDLARAHNNLALCLRDRRRFDEAERHFLRAIALEPDYAEPHNHLGALYRDLGRNDEALAHLWRALRLDADYVDARNNLGMVLRAQGRMTAALAQFERTIRRAPEFAAAHLNLALTLSLVGREEEAMARYREARRLNPAIPPLPER